jgi:hypothetical protein
MFLPFFSDKIFIQFPKANKLLFMFAPSKIPLAFYLFYLFILIIEIKKKVTYIF